MCCSLHLIRCQHQFVSSADSAHNDQPALAQLQRAPVGIGVHFIFIDSFTGLSWSWCPQSMLSSIGLKSQDMYHTSAKVLRSNRPQSSICRRRHLRNIALANLIECGYKPQAPLKDFSLWCSTSPGKVSITCRLLLAHVALNIWHDYCEWLF